MHTSRQWGFLKGIERLNVMNAKKKVEDSSNVPAASLYTVAPCWNSSLRSDVDVVLPQAREPDLRYVTIAVESSSNSAAKKRMMPKQPAWIKTSDIWKAVKIYKSLKWILNHKKRNRIMCHQAHMMIVPWKILNLCIDSPGTLLNAEVVNISLALAGDSMICNMRFLARPHQVSLSSMYPRPIPQIALVSKAR